LDNSSVTLLIFGASGDLTHRKLVPALYNLFIKGRLPAEFRIVGTSRTPFSHDEFRQRMRDGVETFAGLQIDEVVWQEFAENIFYLPGNLKEREDYEMLSSKLAELEAGQANRIYYMAIAPEYYAITIQKLGESGMAQEKDGWRRVVIEKPFGHDLASAHELNEFVHSAFNEHQVYRIDHYLGKETAQNILFFRFANTIFEPVWNRNYVDHVQISVAESVDVGHRADYYDHAGVLRDMFQNHILQLLALITMEPPISFTADAVRDEKLKILTALRSITGENIAANTVRAQYQGYCEVDGVAQYSQTPTYAAIRLFIDNWRWQGVPFYLRSGKALATKTSEILIQFQRPPLLMFNLDPTSDMSPNSLMISIQPDEGIHLRFEAKVPDSAQKTRSVNMDFHFRSSFGSERLPEAYERLLLDAIMGDASLFIRSDEIEKAWQFVDPILDGWEKTHSPELVDYERGSWGPIEANELIEKDGRAWLNDGIHRSDSIHVVATPNGNQS
jgi:glucose-6-phosphate 1-dehydrogenase